MKKFEKYSFDDLINDKSFVKWVLNPTKEINHFWNRFMETYPDKTSDIRMASKIIEQSASGVNYLSDEKVNELWLKIRKNSVSSKRNYKIILYLSAAASFLLLISFGLWYFELRFPVKPDVDYTQVQIPVNADNQVQLVLADDSKVYLNDDEATLMYSNNGKLQTNTQEINISKSSKQELKEDKIALNQIIVPRGKRSSIIFSDGTKLWLNSGSRAIYPVNFKDPRREIFIEGEAFLEVTPNKSMPFVVKTNIMEVQVLGTTFNIKAYKEEDNTSVVLVEGTVKVRAGKQKETQIYPDQMYSYSSSSGKYEVKTDINIFEHIGWKYGWMLCNGEDLGSVFTKLSRYYNIEIDVLDPEIKSRKITGKLELKEEITEVFRVLSIAGSVNYTAFDNNRVMVSRSLN